MVYERVVQQIAVAYVCECALISSLRELMTPLLVQSAWITLMNHWVCVLYYRVASHWWSNELPFQFIRRSEKNDLMVTYPEATILILTWSQFDFNSLWWYLYSGLTRFSGIAYCIFLNNSKKRDGRYHYVNDPAILNVYKKMSKCVFRLC